MEISNDAKKLISKRNYYDQKDAGHMFLLELLIPLLVSFVILYIGYVVMGLSGVSLGENWVSEIYNYLSFSIIYVIIYQFTLLFVFLFFHPIKKIEFSACPLKINKSVDAVTAILCSVLGIVMAVCFIPLVDGTLASVFNNLGITVSSFNIPLDTIGWLLFYIVFFAILPAVVEELIFRGVIFKGIKKDRGVTIAVILSAIMFMLAHLSVTKIVYPLFMGIAFALIVEKTGNIFYTILTHMFSNITTVVVSFLSNIGLLNVEFNITSTFVILSILLALVGVAIFMLFYVFVLRKRKYLVESENVKLEKKDPPVAIYVGIAIAVIVIVLNVL